MRGLPDKGAEVPPLLPRGAAMVQVVTSLLRASPPLERAARAAMYDLFALACPDDRWTFMNHGFAHLDPEAPGPALDPADEPERYCAQLYDEVVRPVPLAGARVLDIGCGRGGGASFLKRYRGAAEVVGLDASRFAVQFCRRRHRVEGLRFVHGHDEALPFGAASFDAVVNVESAHGYRSLDAFFDEVRRVLRPGGHLLLALHPGRDQVEELNAAVARSGLGRVAQADISANVARAMELDAPRREALVKRAAPRWLHPLLWEVSGVEGTRFRQELRDGRRIYLRLALQTPAGRAQRPAGPRASAKGFPLRSGLAGKIRGNMRKPEGRSSAVRRHLTAAADYALGRTDLGRGPPIFAVETTTRCDLSCTMCARQKLKLRARDMDPELFERLIAESRPYLEMVNLFGLGEPLLDPHLADRVRFCKAHGVKTCISTNANRLDQATAEELLRAGVDWITLALDAVSAETYDRYRVGGDFDRVSRNVDTLLTLKRRMRSPVFVATQMVVLPDNQHEARAFVRRWSGRPGVNAVRLKFDEFGLPKMKTLAQVRRKPAPCWYLWNGPLLVRVDGALHRCCPETLSVEPRARFPDVSIAELYNDRAARELRAAHLRGDLSSYPVCEQCCSPKPRAPLAQVASAFHPFTLRRVAATVERYTARFNTSLFDRY